MKLIKKLIVISAIIFIIIITALLIFLGANKDKTAIVRFNVNGGTQINSQIIKKGNKINKPDNPTKEGYEFIEWVLNNETYNFDKPIKKDITLNARWKKETQKNYIVEFNTDGGSLIKTQEVKEGSKIELPQNPTKQGYTFKGWYLDGKAFDINYIVKKDIILVAKWAKNQPVNNNVYTVSFALEDGTIIDRQTVKHGNKAVKSTIVPLKDSYEFAGWTLNDKIYNFNNPITKNITLIAKWQIPIDLNITCYTESSFNTLRPIEITNVKKNEKITCEITFNTQDSHKIKEAQYELFFGDSLTLIKSSDISDATINGRAYKYLFNYPKNRENIGIFTFEIKETINVKELFIRLENIKFTSIDNEQNLKKDKILNLTAN